MILNKEKIKTDFTLSSTDSLVLKGIAICLMLWHHLFTTIEYGEVTLYWGQFGKVCVSIFLFVSGYGLYMQYSKVKFTNTVSFLKNNFIFLLNRLTKFYLNYWFVFLVFVPIGVFVFDIDLKQAYGSNVNLIKRFMYDVFGLQGFYSYNITWWFNKLIILFYLFFPLFYFLTKRFPWTLFIISIFLVRYGHHIVLANFNVDLTLWLLPFVLGLLFAKYAFRVNKLFSDVNYTALFVISLLLFLLFLYLRMNNIIPHWSGIRLDGFLALSLVFLLISFVRKVPQISFVLSFLGKHSINIYLIHTFIFYYWFEQYVYYFENPIIIFCILLLSTLLISMIIEYLKNILGFNKLQSIITRRFNYK